MCKADCAGAEAFSGDCRTEKEKPINFPRLLFREKTGHWKQRVAA